MPDAQDTPPPVPSMPPRTRWPLRPVLSIVLVSLLALDAILVVGLYSTQSRIGHRVAAMVGFGSSNAAEPGPTFEGIVYLKGPDPKTSEPVIVASHLDPAPAPTENVIETVVHDQLPAASVRITSTPLEFRGFWAPTKESATVETTLTPIAGAPPIPADREADVYNALSDLVESRGRPFKFFADLLDLHTSTASGVKTVYRGWLHDVGAILALIALVFSLAPKPNGLINAYDQCVATGRKLGGAAVLGLIWTAAPGILGIMLLASIGDLSTLLHKNIAVGWFAYVLVFMFSAGVGFLPTYGQSILGGWVFGFALGFPGAMAGFVGGSVIGYFIAARVSQHKVEDLLNSNAKARAVRNALIGQGFWKTLGIVTLIRIPPNSPFAITNLALASSGVKFAPYIIGTALGMAPRTAIAVAFAAAGRNTGARDIQQFIDEQPWWAIPVGLAAFVLVLFILGYIANKAIHQVTGQVPGAKSAP